MMETYSKYIHGELISYSNSISSKNTFPFSFFNNKLISQQINIFEQSIEDGTHLATKQLSTLDQTPIYAKIKNTTFAKFTIPIFNNQNFSRFELARKLYFRQFPEGIYSINVLTDKPFYSSTKENTSFIDSHPPKCKKITNTYYCPSQLLINNRTTCLFSLNRNLINESLSKCEVKTRKIKSAISTAANKIYYAFSKSKQFIGQLANFNKTHFTIKGIGSIDIKDFITVAIGAKTIQRSNEPERKITETTFDWGKFLSENIANYLRSDQESILGRITQRKLNKSFMTKSFNLSNFQYITPIVLITYSVILLPILGGYFIIAHIIKYNDNKNKRKMRRMTPFPPITTP